MSDYCQHCLPVKRRSHWDLKADYYMEKIRRTVMRPVDFIAEFVMRDTDWLWERILRFFAFLGAVEFVADPPREQIFNRSLIILDEAKKRGIEVEAIKIFGHFKNEYRYRLPDGQGQTGAHSRPWRYFEANPLADERRSATDHKAEFKNLMSTHGLPVPEGQMFVNAKAGLEFAESLGFPVVVKPATGSLGYHSTYNIPDRDELAKAIEIAQDYRPDFIVERYIPGDNFRATVIGRKYVFVCGKDRSNVVGDGRATIEGLIDKKNNNPLRAAYGRKDTTLNQIPKADPVVLAHLQKQNLRFDTVPEAGQKIYFFDDFVPGSGIDFINISDQVHEANRDLFLRAATLLATDLVGFDLIAEDMTRPHTSQIFVFLEGNSLPYLDMHQFPSHGPSSDIAKTVWDTVLENLV